MINGQISYLHVWFCMGPVPSEMRDPRFAQAIMDPPTNGWHHVLCYVPKRSDAKYAHLFDPSTGWHAEVPIDCMEIAKAKPVEDPPWSRIANRIQRTFRERDRLGVGMSFSWANKFLEMMGFATCVRTREDEVETTEAKAVVVKEPKVDARAGLIQAADIAAEMGIEPRILRDTLRKLKVVKPSVGWAGDRAWADDIKARATKYLAPPKPEVVAAVKAAKKKIFEEKVNRRIEATKAKLKKEKK